MKKHKGGRPASTKPTKDRQLMTRVTDETAEELERVAVAMDRSVSWILNDLAVKFLAQRKAQPETEANLDQMFSRPQA